VDQDLVDQVNDEMDNIWWGNYQYQQWVQDQGVQDQGVQDQDVQLRRYPVRKRQLTVKAAALARE
jgi:hypothetical protein